MLKQTLIEIYERDLLNLKKEINLYEDETRMWVLKNEISNSAGNLCLHLIGNLNHFFGAVLDKNGYVRERDLEFSEKHVSRELLNQKIDESIEVVKNALNNLSEEDFSKDYPVEFQEKTVGMDFMIIHLAAHFNYHLGQINYHRRLI